jgi:hypothetical protein
LITDEFGKRTVELILKIEVNQENWNEIITKSSVIKSELQIYDLMNFFEKKKVRSFDLKFKAS